MCGFLSAQKLIFKDLYTKKEINNVQLIDFETNKLIDKNNYKSSKKILIQNGFYNDLIIEPSQINNPEIFLIPKVTEIQEVVIFKNYTFLGNTEKRAITGKLNEAKEMESVCANFAELNKKSKIISFNFFIDGIRKKSDIQFVIYELSDDNKLGNKIYNQPINSYHKKWNELILNQELILPKGAYYFGIQYVVSEDDELFTYNSRKEIKYFRGPIVGLSKNNVKTVFFGKERNYDFDKYNFMQYLKIYQYEK
jgi:hypothetical protein